MDALSPWWGLPYFTDVDMCLAPKHKGPCKGTTGKAAQKTTSVPVAKPVPKPKRLGKAKVTVSAPPKPAGARSSGGKKVVAPEDPRKKILKKRDMRLAVEAEAEVCACLKPGEVHPGPCKGWKGKAPQLPKTPRKKAAAKPAVAAPQAPATAPTPAGARVAGRDLLQPSAWKNNGLARFGKQGFTSLGGEGADRRLTGLAKVQGFDGPPRVVSDTEMEALLQKTGGPMLYRAINNETYKRSGNPIPGTAEKFAEAYRTGDAFYGTGMYGSGIYFGTDRRYVDGIAEGGGVRIDVAMLPGAKTATMNEVWAEMEREAPPDTRKRVDEFRAAETGLYKNRKRKNNEQNWQAAIDEMARVEKSLKPIDHYYKDASLYAMAKGYDAIQLPASTKPGDQQGIWLVLNRTATAVRRDNGVTASAAADVETTVEACKPPHVSIPHPGPCKGWKKKAGLPDLAKPRKKAAEPKPGAVAKTPRPKKAAAAAVVTAEQRARQRQAAIDTARGHANVLAEMEENLDNGSAQAVLIRQLGAAKRANGNSDDPTLRTLDEALRRRGADGLREAIADAARALGLRKSGVAERYDPKTQRSLDKSMRAGARVAIVRPGYEADVDGERVSLFKAVVEEADDNPVTAPAVAARQPAAKVAAVPVKGKDLLAGRVSPAVLATVAAPDWGPEGDQRLLGLGRLQGFDGLPEATDAAGLDRLKKRGGVELWRGVGDLRSSNEVVKTAAQINEEFRSGRMHYGTGIYGNGIYATPQRHFADLYAKKGSPGSLLRVVLKPGAKTITWPQLWQQMQRDTPADILAKKKDLENHDRWVLGAINTPREQEVRNARDALRASVTPLEELYMDSSMFALSKGYDAIHVPLEAEGQPDEWILLNRTATAVERTQR